MRIGLNLVFMLPDVVGGTQTYAVSLIRALAEVDVGNEYLLYVNAESAALDIVDAPNMRVVPCRVHASRRPARYAFEQLVLPWRVRRDRLDVLHSLGYVGPLAAPCPHVVTIHDLIYVGFGDYMSASRRAALQFFVRGSARRAAQVIAVSAASKAQIVGDIDLDPSRVTVIHEAPRPIPDEATLHDSSIRRAYGIQDRYIVAFGSLSPSKNIPRLVEAFAEVSGQIDEDLVLVGHLADASSLRDQIAAAGISDRVVLTGFVPDEHVLPLIAQASVFAFPSVFEGFGLPILDAQAVGVPVVSSDAASLPEVAGDGAVLVDPQSTAELAAALRSVLADPALRQRLVERGRANVDRFSWHDAARATLQVYREVLGR